MHLGELLHALAPDPSGGFRVDIPEDWNQGRTLFGGLNAALAGRAARLHDAHMGPLRTVQIAFMAPAAGALRYVPVTLRQGRSVSFVGVDAIVGAQLCARAILTYGQPRRTDAVHSRVPVPATPAPEASPEVPLLAGTTPAFLEHMELRHATGSTPASGGEPEFAWWVRHRGSGDVDAELGALAVADVLPPAVLASQRTLRPGSSVTWTIDFTGELPRADSWYLLSTTSQFAEGGYSIQAMDCFSANGSLVSVSRQTVAIF